MVSFILPGNSASGGFDVANSCRFDSGSDAHMHITYGSAGNQKKWSWSGWIKRGIDFTGQPNLFAVGTSSNTFSRIMFNNDSNLVYYQAVSGATGCYLETDAAYRDPSAWMHILVSIDTTLSTANNRNRLWVNGTEITSFTYRTNYDQNYDGGINDNVKHYLGGTTTGLSDTEWDGYMAEVIFQDGVAHTGAGDFGEFDEDSGIWKPKDVSGLTLGSNGFYLDFEDSSSLGNDKAGSNNFTVSNISAIDQSTDTCTNNYSTINSLDNHFYNATLSEGNLKQTANASNYSFGTSTFGVSQGKWVVEVKIESGSTVRNVMGITDKVSTGTTNELGNSGANAWQYSTGGNIYNNGSDIGGSYASSTTNDIIGMYLDLDNNKLYFSKNGAVQNSGTGISITAPSSTTNGVYFFAFGDFGASDDSVNNVNFGSPAFAISSGNTDGEYGNFEYTTTITGDSASKTFKALNTKNLSEFG